MEQFYLKLDVCHISFLIFFDHSLTSNDILYGVMFGFILLADQSAMSIPIKTEIWNNIYEWKFIITK
jgi:hypothetical protein